MKKDFTTIAVNKELAVQLKLLAEQQNQSISELVSEMLKAYVLGGSPLVKLLEKNNELLYELLNILKE